MKNKAFLVYILIFLFALGIPSVFSQAKETATISEETIVKKAPSYGTSLKRLIDQANKNLKKVNEVIQNKENEEIAEKLVDEGTALYKEGQIKEAKAKWKEALKLTKSPAMKKKIRNTERALRDEARAAERKLKEEEKAKRDAEKKARLEAERKAREMKKQEKEAEKAKRDAEKKARLEAERKAREAKKEVPKVKKSEPAPKPVVKPVYKPAPAPKPVTTTTTSTKDVSRMYTEAVSLYWSQKYEEAKVKFEEIQKIQPGFSRTEYYLERISEKID